MIPTRPGRTVAAFDSASAMLRILAAHLHGRDAPALGQRRLEPLGRVVTELASHLPVRMREQLYALSGWREALPPSRLGRVRDDELAAWVVDQYPARQYPVVFIGSSNGAAMHLAAALGAPWLPQTLLIPVRESGYADEPRRDLDAGRSVGRRLLDANPRLSLHHMHDANQDRLMIRYMTYCRTKWRALPPHYERFLAEQLAPGGTVVIVDCGLTWPVTTVADRHVFQHGALGGATVDEYAHGSERVADYLARYGASVRKWDAPAADRHVPEAEWGYDPTWDGQLSRLARARGLSIERLRFSEPEQLSPIVADLYARWYERRGIAVERLLVESFIFLEPWWTLRTGSVPFWMVFNTEPSLSALEDYLDGREPFDEIRMGLFSHGVESVGLVPIGRWAAVLGRARKIGSFVGVDVDAYPRDFASIVQFHRDLTRIRHVVPMPDVMRWTDARAFLAERGVLAPPSAATNRSRLQSGHPRDWT